MGIIRQLGGRLESRRFDTALLTLAEQAMAVGLPTRFAGHALMLALALAVAGTVTFTPVHRAVNQALESFSIEEAAVSEAPIARPAVESSETPVFTPPDEATMATLRPRASVIAYTVKPGDSVNKIAAQYNITPSTIVWANNLTDPDKLPVGHALLILPMSGVLHTLKAGETLEAVAAKYQIEPSAIAEANGLALDKQLPPPLTPLVIPGGRLLEPERPEVSTRAVDRGGADQTRPASGAPATTAPPVDAAPKPIKPVAYDVQEGDTVLSIARKFGVSPGTIVQANGIAGAAADNLKIGQKLTILPVDGIVHKVADGDMVRELAAHYGVETAAIIKANGLVEPYLLQPGQEIVIPGGKVPDQTTDSTPAPEATPIPYKVEAGDNVVSIAERFGLDPRIVARYNGLDRADLIAPGQSLMIPPGARAIAAGSAAPRSAEPPAPIAAPAPRTQNPLAAAAALVRPIVAPAPPPPPAPKPVVAGDNWSIVAAASKYLGYAYVWGGQSPRYGFDCTGFTWYVYQQIGKGIPLHDLWGQLQSGARVGRGNLQAGDLVFFANTYMPGLSHVGIYIGGGRFIHAGSERTGVTVSSLNDAYWGPRYFAASRPW